MTNEKEQDRLEMEKIKLERFKEWRKIITVAITVLFGSVLVALINYSIQGRQLKQQKLLNEKELALQKKKAEADIDLQEAKAEAERRQAEMKYLGDFITFALEDDYNKRLRFAGYFAELTLSKELKTNWMKYRQGIVDKQKKFEETKELLAKAKEVKDVKRVEELTTKVIQQQAQLEAIPEKTDVYTTRGKAGLGKEGQPQNYTTNKFELKTIINDQVVIDHATGLMWQQSGSDGDMTYKEAERYIDKLNIEKFAGYSNWRLPTLEEAKSLIEPKENIGGLYIDSRFDSSQLWIWTVDLKNSSRVWIVNFDAGSCGFIGFDYDFYVRAVR